MLSLKLIKLSLILVLMLAAVANSFATDQFSIQSTNMIVDQAGRRIVIQEPFKRVISLYGAHTENLFSLGLSNEIIGVTQHDDYPSQARDKAKFSYHDDPEKFLAARPDLVLIRPMIDRGYPQFVAMLEKSGIIIVSLQPGTIDEMFTYWSMLGLLTGKQSRAHQMIRKFKECVGKFKDLIGKQVARKHVYFEAIHNKMKTFAPNSMAVFTLECAGGINVAADAKPVRNTNIAYYGKERILSRASEIEVYLAQYGAMNRPTIAMIKEEPGFSAIKAVAADRIYLVDEKIVSRPTMRLLEGIYTIGRYLYPDVFDDRALKILEQ